MIVEKYSRFEGGPAMSNRNVLSRLIVYGEQSKY